MDMTFLREPHGSANLSPFWGRFKASWVVSRPGFVSRAVLLRAYAALLAAGALGGAIGLVLRGVGVGSPVAVAVLAIAALYAEAHTVRISPVLEVSAASILTVFAAVLFGPLAAMVVGTAGLLGVLKDRSSDAWFLRWIIWTCSRAVVAGLAGLAALETEGGQITRPALLVAAVAAASAVDLVGDVLLAPIPAVIRRRARWRDVVRSLLAMQVSALPFHLPLIGLLAYAYVRISPWSVALFVLPVFAAQRLLLLYHQQRATSEELAVVNKRLVEANISFASALVATLDARDRYTAGHSAAVAVYARDIAVELGLSKQEQQMVHLCGLVHDIGKVGLPAGLLEKEGPLSLQERRQMELHSIIGERILSEVDDYADIARIVRHHHERLDGMGYPDRLAGEEIPLLARILTVADAYNAMTSDRPYRDAMSSSIARWRLGTAVGTQFDGTVVEAFERILDSESHSYCMGTRADFTLAAQKTESPLSRVA